MAKESMPLYFKDKEEKEKLKAMSDDLYSHISFNGMFIHLALEKYEKYEKQKRGK